MPDRESVPKFHELMWPTLEALKELGGSGTIREIAEKVVELGRFSDEQLAVLHRNGPDTEIEYRLAWARTYLKGAGAVINSRRGVWSITEHGRALTREDVSTIPATYRAHLRGATPEVQGEVERAEASTMTWKEELLDTILSLSPETFERLAKRLLREAGFVNVTVTGRSGDGGIDGTGVYQVSLLSFPVVFQCKRWRGSVGAPEVRNLRGAMQGRGDKGFLITTGSFTREARQEATREGTPPIDLIDGDRLCELLREFELGLAVTARQLEEVTVESSFFSEL